MQHFSKNPIESFGIVNQPKASSISPPYGICMATGPLTLGVKNPIKALTKGFLSKSINGVSQLILILKAAVVKASIA